MQLPKPIATSSLGEIWKLVPDADEPTSSTPPPKNDLWPVMDDAAYHGLAGDFVKTVQPHTESDPAGLLLQFITTFGNLVGHCPYYLVEGDRHHTNLYDLLVGNTSRGRKGTGFGRVRALCQDAYENWFCGRTASGLSSGEGLISNVRDERMGWNAKDKREEVIDPGVKDKRLLVTEPEFAGALSVMDRHGNNLSPVIRNAWDGLILQTMVKNSPLKATGAHISIIGHITKDELRARLTRTDMANGFANRFLFCLVKRSKLLPHGGHPDDASIRTLADRFAKAVEFAKTVGRVTMTDGAAAAWATAYAELSADRPGLLGAVTARAEAQVIRLALNFALLDQNDRIDTAHLGAAMAVWAFCDESAHFIFSDAIGDPVADNILAALRRSPAGMTRTSINDLFGGHRMSDQINAALATLLRLGRARFETKQTAGRPVETWFTVGEPK
jgi:hypothetical protein